MPIEFLLIPFGAFAAALVVGLVGFGDGLIATAIWLHVLSPGETVPLVVATGIVIHGISLLRLHGALDYSKLWWFLGGGLLGVPVGNWLLRHSDPEIFRNGVGVFLVLYGLVFLLRPPKAHFSGGGRTADAVAGFLGGTMGGLAGLSGILPSIWAGVRGWPKEQQRGLFQPFTLTMHGMALALLAMGGFVDWETGINFLWCLPAVLLGSWLGLRYYGRLDEGQFRRIVLGILLVLGIMLLF